MFFIFQQDGHPRRITATDWLYAPRRIAAMSDG
jgi:hypothetical protein